MARASLTRQLLHGLAVQQRARGCGLARAAKVEDGQPRLGGDAATGKPYYMGNRIPELDTIYASPVAAGGHVYLTSRNGKTTVIKDAAELSVVATNDVGETVDATPAPVDNELFIRGDKHLFCIAKSN